MRQSILPPIFPPAALLPPDRVPGGRPAAHVTGGAARAPDGAATAAAEQSLPSWDLSDLYPSRDSPALEADLRQADADARAFAERYAGRLAELSGAELAAAIVAYQRIDEVLGRIMSFAQLMFAGDSTDPAIGRFYQTMTERVTAITTHLLFFSLELNRLDDAALEARLADPALAAWRPWLRDLRVFRPHQLSDELEKLLHEKEVTGASAWSRLFDETIAGMRVPVAGEEPDRECRAEQAVGPRPLGARDGGAGDRGDVRRQFASVRADHQHARQGQGDHRHLAALPTPEQLPQPLQHGRG